MRRVFLLITLLVGLLATGRQSRAFSLIGEIPPWFTDQTGALLVNGDIYGPMNLGEEYRWTVPNLVYSFDESFLNYFGEKGVEEVEKALAIFNALPAMSSVDVDAYPLNSQRVNHRARDLGLYDLKSTIMQSILEELGLGTPGRFVFTSRGRYPDSTLQITNYLVVVRNFDPVTWNPTPYINGQLWTYTDIFDNQDSPTIKSGTITQPVDPLIQAEPVASLMSSPLAYSIFGYGSYYSGLTRDDVGGLRYIYRRDNYNVETLPADASGLAGSSSLGGGGGGTGEWTPIAAPSTNATAGGGVTTTNGIFFSQALRSGVDTLRFVRGARVYQPGAFAFTNRFEETIRAVVTNGVERTLKQRITRRLTVPDILFSAGEMVVDADGSLLLTTRTEAATSNDAINGGNVPVALFGPGQFDGTVHIQLNKVGPTILNTAPFFLGQPSQFDPFMWGTFDGSTNDPVVYPSGTSIRDAEARVFGSR